MPRRGVRKTKLSKNFKNRRIDIEEIPFTTMKVTIHALRWIFLLIFIYISVSIILLFFQGGNESITNIIVYSVMGFFTFFMGYFGWMFAQSIMEIVSGKKIPGDEF
ncbi:MAG: hypothetical protein KKC68_00345 [Candidatus Thermoplasmatota archaeon]|nr:hypothetical protein [Candidatus Thermoplasmatota archaeon]MBU1940201.1 hypothetical protein [Candidatus Thermoplasmatota archaeon]